MSAGSEPGVEALLGQRFGVFDLTVDHGLLHLGVQIVCHWILLTTTSVRKHILRAGEEGPPG